MQLITILGIWKQLEVTDGDVLVVLNCTIYEMMKKLRIDVKDEVLSGKFKININ